MATTPFCVARRSGEILRVNSTFSELVEISQSALLRERRFFELLTEEACVNYWEQLIPIFADEKAASLVTSTIFHKGGFFQKPETATEVSCFMMALVRRDRFGMPVLVAITVIPIRPCQ